MKIWLTLTLAVAAAALLVVAAAFLLRQDEGDDPTREDGFPATPEEDESDEDEPERPLQSEASIEVTEAWIDDGDCISVAQEEDVDSGDDTQQAQQDQEEGQENGTGREACHRLRVTVTAHPDRPFLVSVGLWEAVDQEGVQHNASWVRSPDPLDAGGTRSVVVSFDTDDDVRLQELRYEDPDGPSLSVMVGGYERDLSGDEVVEAQ